jgi:hypothetical protein
MVDLIARDRASKKVTVVLPAARLWSSYCSAVISIFKATRRCSTGRVAQAHKSTLPKPSLSP